MKNKILSDLYQSQEMAQLINKMQPENLREDLKQEVFLVLCEMPEEKIIALHVSGQLRWFVTRIVLNMIKSDRSDFFVKYRKMITVDVEQFMPPQQFSDNDLEREEQEQEQSKLLQTVEAALKNMHWYTRELFQLYVHHGSAGKIVAEMKATLGGRYIPRSTIYDEVNKAKDEIKGKVRKMQTGKVVSINRKRSA